jgi:hypothetical protein
LHEEGLTREPRQRLVELRCLVACRLSIPRLRRNLLAQRASGN